MSRTVVLALFWTCLGSGCGGIADRADYAESLAKASCSKIERCELGRFESEYSSREDCIRELQDNINDASESYEDSNNDCKYQADEAGSCVRRVSGLSCEEWSEGEVGQACDLVYFCEGTGSTFTSSPPSTVVSD